MSKEDENEEVIENEEVEENENDEPEETLLDVISDAIDEATPEDVLEANKPADDGIEPDDTTDQNGDGSDDDDEQTDEEKAAAEAEAAKGEEDETDEPGEAGEAEAEKTDEEKAAEAEAATAAAAEEVDPINDPIPESTKAETATRIKALIDIAKDSTGRAEQGEELVARIAHTGADPEQYANALGFLSLYNSKDLDTRKKALDVVEAVARDMRVELGVGKADLLEQHEDLQAEIEAGTLTEVRAIEIAGGREKNILQNQRTEASNRQTANDQATTDLIATGKAQLTTLENTLTASDPDYARLRPTFIAMLQPALRKTHASDWGETAQEIYRAVKLANPVVEKVVPKVPKNTPLRPKGSGGGSKDKTGGPETALAAIEGALASM